MAAVAKQSAIAAGTLGVADLPSNQLTPNFFNSIFNDGMNPFDECFGSLTPSGNASLLASTLRKEYHASGIERPKLLKDEALPTINTRLDQTLTPEQSPKTLATGDASISTQLNLSRSPSPFTFSITTTFPDSPVSSITPITSPEGLTPVNTMTREQAKNLPFIEPATQKNSRKSVSAPKASKSSAHKRNLSLPQNWNPTMQVVPQIPDAIRPVPENELLQFQTKPQLRAKPRSSDAPVPQLVSRMDGIFVTESIPSSEIKAEPISPTMAGFQSINSSNIAAGRKRKKSSTDDDDDDEENSKLNESEKRARFLERNRIAASKCRKKKKLMNQRLEEKSRLLIQQNRFLSATLTRLRGEVLRLKQLVLTHHGCGHAPIEQYLHKEAGKYLATDNEEAAKKLKPENTKPGTSPKVTDVSGVFKSEDDKVPTWLNEFHSFQEVESEALKRSGHLLEFDDDDFQKLLLGDQLTLIDDEFGTSPPLYE
ncbi:hypothetical protein ABW19_dt0208092 [Dactylella cylindrospora]|nr:hypothetical protein ABW19_dt0208092 [Dactylella cylindrospora]